MRSALLRLGARLLFGLGDVDRRGPALRALAGIAGGSIRVVIAADLWRQVGPGDMAYAGEHRVAEGADRRESIGGAGGDADRRQRLLIGLRRAGDVVEIVELAGIGKPRLGPRGFDDIEDLGEAVAAFAIRHLIGVVGADDAAASDTENQPALADLVNRRGLLGKAQRMAQWQDLHGDADLHMAGARRPLARDGPKRRQRRGPRRAKGLRQPPPPRGPPPRAPPPRPRPLPGPRPPPPPPPGETMAQNP